MLLAWLDCESICTCHLPLAAAMAGAPAQAAPKKVLGSVVWMSDSPMRFSSSTFLRTHCKKPLSNTRAPHWRQNQPLTWPCLPRLWWKVFLRGALIARQNVQCTERNLKSCRNVLSVRAALILCYTARLIETASNNWQCRLKKVLDTSELCITCNVMNECDLYT